MNLDNIYASWRIYKGIYAIMTTFTFHYAAGADNKTLPCCTTALVKKKE